MRYCFFHFDQGHLYHKIWLWNWNCYEKLWWWLSVMVSIVANLIVVIVLWVRRKRMKATHWFIVALALSDICFSLLLHPMLVATSFGSDSSQLFSKAGNYIFKFRSITINYQKTFYCCNDIWFNKCIEVKLIAEAIKQKKKHALLTQVQGH